MFSSLQRVQTDSGTHLVSYSLGTRGLSIGIECEGDHTHFLILLHRVHSEKILILSFLLCLSTINASIL